MHYPPHPNSPSSTGIRDGYPSSHQGQNYPGQQMPYTNQGYSQQNSHQQLPPFPGVTNTTTGMDMRLPRSGRQKAFIVIALLVTSLAVLSIPVFALQPLIMPNIGMSSTPKAHSTPGTTSTTVGQVMTPTPPLGPMEKTILPPQNQVLTGVSMPGDLDAVKAYEKDTGKGASILFSYQAWGDPHADFPSDWASSVHKHGSLPMITWEPWVTKAYPQGNDEPMYALKNITSGKFDTYITKRAQDAKTWRNPFFLRFAPEMNGNWTPWSEGINGNKAGDYVQAWQHVYHIFAANHVTNATWVWCPNIKNTEQSAPISEYYPGDAYVDWTGIDGFNWGTTTQYSKWYAFAGVFSTTYNQITKITSKPIIIAETGSVEKGGNKAAWITDAYSVEIPNNFPAIKAVAWFNQITQQDWRIESSSAAQTAYIQAMKASNYASNTYDNYIGG